MGRGPGRGVPRSAERGDQARVRRRLDGMTSDARPAARRAAGLRGCRVLGGLALALLAVVELTPAAGWLARRYAEPARLEPAEAIVALGGGFGPDGWLDAASWRRLVHG